MINGRTLVLCLIAALIGQCTISAPGLQYTDADKRILSKPIPFGSNRRQLTLSYIRRHYDPRAVDICIVPEMIVIHWTGSPSLNSALHEFHADEVSESRRELVRAGAVNVSAQFMVDRDGSIYQLMPAKFMARHTIGLNPVAIGIENVGDGGNHPLTADQLQANVWLVKYLKATYPGIHYLIGHNEYLRFRGTPLWREKDPKYFDRKPDPGSEFINSLRAKVRPLQLAEAFDGYRLPDSHDGHFSCDQDSGTARQ